MIVNVPVYGNVNFPDEMTSEEIEEAIKTKLGLGEPRDIGIGETIARGLERGVTSDIRGGAQLLQKAGIDVGAGPEGFEASDPLTAMMGTPLAPEGQRASLATPDVRQETDFERELRFRLATEENPVAGYGSLIAGAIASPLNLIPLGGALKTGGQAAKQFAVAGAVGGALDPVYEEFDDSRLLNIAAGTALGGALGFGVGKLIEKFGRKVTDDILNTGAISPDGNEIITPHFKLRKDENGEWIQEEIPVTDTILAARRQAEERREADRLAAISVPEAPDPVLAATKIIEKEALPVLPKFLSGANPKVFDINIDFETDLDKALYTIGRSKTESARHGEFVDFVQKSLGIDKPQVTKLAAEVHQNVIKTVKNATMNAGVRGIKTLDRVSFGMSKTLDNFLNPADKYLDEISKRVYNIGAGYKTSPKGYAVLNPKQALEAQSVLRRVDPALDSGLMEASQKAVAYRRYLDDMKTLKGKDYKPRAFDDFVKNGLNADDQIRLMDAGYFDGCI